MEAMELLALVPGKNYIAKLRPRPRFDASISCFLHETSVNLPFDRLCCIQPRNIRLEMTQIVNDAPLHQIEFCILHQIAKSSRIVYE